MMSFKACREDVEGSAIHMAAEDYNHWDISSSRRTSCHLMQIELTMELEFLVTMISNVAYDHSKDMRALDIRNRWTAINDNKNETFFFPKLASPRLGYVRGLHFAFNINP